MLSTLHRRTGIDGPEALTRDTRGISLAMYAVFTVGIALWLVYGVLLRSWPMIIANIVTLGLASAILAMKFANRVRDRAPAGR